MYLQSKNLNKPLSHSSPPECQSLNNFFPAISYCFSKCCYSWHHFRYCLCCCCCCSVDKSCPTLCDPMNHSIPGLLSLTVFRSLLKFMSIESVIPSNHLILYLSLLLLPSIFPTIRVFSIEMVHLIKQPKFWSFSTSPSNEYLGWFPLGLTCLISLLSKGLSRVFFSITIQKH